MSGPAIAIRRSTVGGYPTRALAVDGSGPVLVFLHGNGDWADTWRGVLAEVARAGRTGIAYDLPGFGHSSRRPPGSLLGHLDAFTAAVVAIDEPALGDSFVARAFQSDRPNLALRVLMRDLRFRAPHVRDASDRRQRHSRDPRPGEGGPRSVRLRRHPRSAARRAWRQGYG